MAVDLDIKITFPENGLNLRFPGSRTWYIIGSDEVAEIRKRTENRGLDYQGSRFRPYSPNYRQFRIENGRSSWPNLSFSGKMLGAMARGITAKSDSVRLQLTGAEGGKAVKNEERGREFFNISDKRAQEIAQRYADLLEKENK